MDFFYNPNVSCTIVEQVPCAFAPTNAHGNMGTHFVCLMLDTNNNVIHIDCQCEVHHGEEVIRTMEDMGGDTCYQFVGKLRDVLSGRIKGLDRLVHNAHRERESTLISKIDQIIYNIERTRGLRRTLACHTEDSIKKQFGGPMWARMLTRIARTITSNPLISITWLERVAGVREIKEKGYFSFLLDNDLIATRGIDELWNLSSAYYKESENPRTYQQVHIPKAGKYTTQPFVRWSNRNRVKCVVCRKSFERMSKHEASVAHHDELVSQLKRAMKFTEGEGFKAVRAMGATYFKPPERKTQGKIERKKQRIEDYLEENVFLPNLQEWSVYTGQLGFKDIALTRYSERTCLSMEEALEIFEEVEKKPELQKKVVSLGLVGVGV